MTGGVKVCRSEEEIAWLVSLIHQTERHPVVVGSLGIDEQTPKWDVVALVRRLEDEAIVVLVDTEGSYLLTNQMGGKANSVHSGWVRIYPAGAWRLGDQNQNKITPAVSISKIVDRVLQLGFQTYVPTSLPTANLVRDSVVIDASPSADTSALLSGRSETDPSRHPIIRYSGIYPGIPANRLFKKGMKLQGNRTKGILPDFFPEKPVDDLKRRLLEFVGDIVCTWALVGEVRPNRVEIFMHPEATVEIISDIDDLTYEYTKGSVVKVVVMATLEGWEASAASDQESAIDAISALPGGPPWLLPPEIGFEPEVVEQVESVSNVSDDEEMVFAHQVIEKLEREVASLKEKLRSSRAKRIGLIHPSDERCLRAAIVADYYSRFTQSDREGYPLPELIFGPDFFAGFSDTCLMVPYDTVLRSVVNVAIGHPQTKTEKFQAGSRFGDEIDGWQIRRGHIAEVTSGAPRIRFAKKGSSVRFEWTGHHDDDL